MLEADLKFTRGRLPIDVRLRLPHLSAGILGPSGSGKSCLLSMLAGDLDPDTGYIALDSIVLFDSRRHINRLREHSGIVLVSEEQTLDADKTVRENLLSLAREASAGRNSLDFAAVAACLELEDLLDFRASHLSKGEKQRILLGRALLASPRLLLLDDALSPFDSHTKTKIFALLRYAQQKLGLGIVQINPALTELLRLTDFLVLMAQGRVLDADYLPKIVPSRHLLESAGGPSIDNILPVSILGHDAIHGCTIGLFFGLQLVLPYTPRAAAGDLYYVGLRSQDIALSLQPITDISIQNQLKGRVCAVIPQSDRVLIQVDAGATLTVEITLRAFAALQIREQQSVYCLVKTHSFSILTDGSSHRSSADTTWMQYA